MRLKGKQVEVLYDLVTVSREYTVRYRKITTGRKAGKGNVYEDR